MLRLQSSEDREIKYRNNFPRFSDYNVLESLVPTVVRIINPLLISIRRDN